MSLLFNKMSPLKIFFYILRFKKCSNCGNMLVGNGEGSFELTEKGFKRECKCGTTVQTSFAKVSNKEYEDVNP